MFFFLVLKTSSGTLVVIQNGIRDGFFNHIHSQDTKLIFRSPTVKMIIKLVVFILILKGYFCEDEPMCLSRWDYEHKMLRHLSKLEDRVDKLEATDLTLEKTIRSQKDDIQVLQQKGI